jgi:hypothetical protein
MLALSFSGFDPSRTSGRSDSGQMSALSCLPLGREMLGLRIAAGAVLAGIDA